VIAYSLDGRQSLPLRSFPGHVADEMYADAHGWPRSPSVKAASSEGQLAKSGIALVCLAAERDWANADAARAARDVESRRIDVEITREFMGIAGAPQRYILFIIPPSR
jgi:hypothetical protein